MFALLLALAAGLSWGTADFIGGLATRRLRPATVLLVAQGAGLLFTGAVVALAGEGVPPSRSLAIGALGGVFGAVGLAALYRGLAVGRMSVVAPTAALSGTVPVAVGFLQGDRPSAVQAVGMALAGIGIVLAARTPDEEPRDGKAWAAGVGSALVAALFLGALVTCLDAAGDASPEWGAFSVRLSSAPLFVIAWLATTDRSLPGRTDLVTLACIGVLDNAANIAFAVAARQGLLSLVAVVGSLYPVSTVLLARGVLHERMARHQVIGVVAAFVGVALIAAG
jgi:drug/metabolite transporter (DMT)-like permease